MGPDDNNTPKGGLGFLDIVTSLKNLVIGINTINQTVAKVFPSWTAGQIPGTTTNGLATAGNIGEYISSTVLVGGALALSTGTAKTITSIALTGGDWDVGGTVAFTANAATTATEFSGGINSVTNTLPTIPGAGASAELGISVAAAGVMPTMSVGSTRISISTPTTIYLIAESTFAVNSMSAYGFLGARRRR